MYRLVFVLVLVTTLIIGGLFYSLSILKGETINNHLKIAKIHNTNFSYYLQQSLENLDLLSNNIVKHYKSSMNNNYKDILEKYLFIKSINIVDEKNRVLFSTNSKNLDLLLKIDGFLPKPLFDTSILRISESFRGRDIFDKEDKKSKLSFFLVSKEFNYKNKNYKVVYTINSDFFINRYSNEINKEISQVDVLRIDKKGIFSTSKYFIEDNFFLDDAINNGVSEGLMYKEYILSYKLVENYPLVLMVSFDYKKSLSNWNNKESIFYIINTLLLLISMIIVLFLLIRYKKQKEKEIRIHKEQIKEQKRFKALFEESHLVNIIVDNEGNIKSLNHSALEIIGKDRESLINTKVWDSINWFKEDKVWIKSSILNHYSDKNYKELNFLNTDGKKRVVDFVISSLNIEYSNEIVIAGLDVTEKKITENKLQQSYIVFNNTHDGIVITDENIKIVNVNSAFSEVTGYSLDEVVNKNPNILQSGKQDRGFYDDLWDELRENGFWEGEVINKKKSSDFYNEWLRITAVYDENRNIKNYIGVFTDVTEQKKQEAELKHKQNLLYQQSKMASMGEMLGNIAHQWRQPLSAISTASSGMLLQKEMGILSDELFKDFCNGITKNSKYLSETIEDFRNFYQKDKEKETFCVKQAIIETLSLLEASFKNKDILIDLKAIDEVFIDGVENEFKQVIMNILNNAKDALLQKKGERFIVINIFKQDNRGIIEIIDNGGGIEADIISKVFEPYFTTKHQSLGTGIGLYMAEEIIKRSMKGNIIAENIEFIHNNIQSKGANFRMELKNHLNSDK